MLRVLDTQIAKFMGPTWVLAATDGPHDGPIKLVIRVSKEIYNNIVIQWRCLDAKPRLTQLTYYTDMVCLAGCLIDSDLWGRIKQGQSVLAEMMWNININIEWRHKFCKFYEYQYLSISIGWSHDIDYSDRHYVSNRYCIITTVAVSELMLFDMGKIYPSRYQY